MQELNFIFFWGGAQPLPRPHSTGEGTPLPRPTPRAIRPLATPPPLQRFWISAQEQTAASDRRQTEIRQTASSLNAPPPTRRRGIITWSADFSRVEVSDEITKWSSASILHYSKRLYCRSNDKTLSKISLPNFQARISDLQARPCR